MSIPYSLLAPYMQIETGLLKWNLLDWNRPPAELSMPLQPGSILHRRYRIEGILGQGGMGAVYEAFDINLGVRVAVKENLFTTEEYARQFRREATILASLRHPNLPRVTDHFVIEGEGQYLVMDFIQGGDLRERLEGNGPIPEVECIPWFVDICDALAYLHSRNPPILHRDIKPGNIKVMPDGRAMLVDFGLAKVVDASGATTTGAKAMTPGFSPPEQYGTGRTDPRTDVYSLGATIYAALTATIPEDALERAMGRDKLTPIRKRNPKINPALARVVTKALAVKPDERYQTVNELAAALGASSSSSRPTIVRNYTYLDRTVPLADMDIPEDGPTVSRKVHDRKLPRMLLFGLLSVVVLAVVGFTVATVTPALTDLFSASPATSVAGPEEPTNGNEGEPPTAPVDGGEVTDTPVEGEATSPSLPTEPGEETTIPVAAATPAGGGVGQVAYASEQSGKPQIHLVNIDGTDDHPLTSGPDGACQPAWSPDGRQLIFTSPCRGNQDTYPGSSLWIMDVDMAGVASQPRQLRTMPGGDFDPAWSPDGTQVAFSSVRDNRPQVYVMNLDGTGLQNLSNDLARDREAAWSPGGQQMLFTSTRSDSIDIWLMPAAGGEERRFSWDSDRDETHASWSHDGEFILYERGIGGVSRLIVAPFEDGGVVDNPVCPQGDRTSQPMSEPDWSPDDQWIVFETWPDGVNHDIAIIRSTCTNYAQLTTTPGNDFDAAWRPGS